MTERSIAPGWATYLRVSDEDKQTPERSFAMQRQRIQEQLLTPSDIQFKREYCDMLTGTSPNRKDYQQMLADAEKGQFSHLGLYRADRFGRNAIEGLQAATRLISLGIKLRVANMPSLEPESPDGFFMFLLQMGLAQREVDVLRERTRDGMEAKMRMGGWPQKAPDGYINKERLVKSNKYDRWVELEPESSQVIKQAWDLLLTERYTLKQICEELSQRGYTRAHGNPWSWNDPKTGERYYAENRLHQIFHNPFYAGWAVSERFGIRKGEIKGHWEPIINNEQFELGVEILHNNDIQKSREKNRFYLLRTLIWIEIEGKFYRMFGSTPRGHSLMYSYYITHAKPTGKKLHIRCDTVDSKISDWLAGIAIDPSIIHLIKGKYQSQIEQVKHKDKQTKLAELKLQLAQLREEEARLGRLLITNKISETVYDQLRKEWQVKLRHVELNLAELERDTTTHLDDLDLALVLMAQLPLLYKRIREKERAILLQILVKRIIVDPTGEIINYELNSPFVYLRSLVDNLLSQNLLLSGSEQISLGTQKDCSPSNLQ